MSTKKFTKICTICGEKAIGFNFGAISCESCKAFFRRNASKHDIKCAYGDNCKINQETRKYCRKCRLTKCFAVGMRQDWILSEEQKEMRKVRIELNKKYKENNQKRRESSVSSQSESICSDFNEWQLFETNDMSDEDIITDIMEIEKYLFDGQKETTVALNEENGVINRRGDLLFNLTAQKTNVLGLVSNQNATTSTMQIDKYIPKDEMEMTNEMNGILKVMKENNTCESLYHKALELDFASLPIPRTYMNLAEIERNRLIELMNATLIFKEPYPALKLQKIASLEHVAQFFIVMFESFIEKFVKVAKSVNAFTNMSEEDKIALVKYSSFEALLLRTAIYYNDKEDQWIFNMDSKNSVIFDLDLLRKDRRNVYPVFKNYLSIISSEWDKDSFILDLLMAILLFNPDRPHITNREAIKRQQHLYTFLLQRYLQLKYKSESESRVKFLRILSVLQDIHKLDQIQRSNNKKYERVYHPFFGPLFREILDFSSENSLFIL